MFNPLISSQGKLRNGWWIAIFFVVLAALLLPLILLARQSDGATPIWQQAIIVVMATIICQVLRRRSIAEPFGRFDVLVGRQFLVGLVLGALLMLAPAGLLWALGAVHWTPGAGASAIAPSLALFAVVAITEEVLFRGFLFQRLIDGLGAIPAQLIIAALFVLTHSDALSNAGSLGLLAGVNIFIASLMFGFAYLRTRGLALPIGLHLAANFVQGGVLGFGVSGGDQAGLLQPTLSAPDWLTGGAFGLEASAPGLVAVCLTTLVLAYAPSRPR